MVHTSGDGRIHATNLLIPFLHLRCKFIFCKIWSHFLELSLVICKPQWCWQKYETVWIETFLKFTSSGGMGKFGVGGGGGKGNKESCLHFVNSIFYYWHYLKIILQATEFALLWLCEFVHCSCFVNVFVVVP